MRRWISHSIISALCLMSVTSVAQNPTLAFDDFMDMVSAHHPVAKQADLQLRRGEAALLIARGSFDPKLDAGLRQKYFDGTQYYHLLDAGLKVPTWFGVHLQGGYEDTDGAYLNPEATVPDNGLWYAGVGVTLGKGLFIDERRAQLKQAKIFQEATVAQRQLILNQLLLEAGLAYWDWFYSFEVERIYREALVAAEQRFNAVLQSAELGDRPYIDTLEAGIQVQNRQLMLREAELMVNNASAQLAVYLWADGIVPLEVNTNTQPAPLPADISLDPSAELYIWKDSLIAAHPDLQQTNFKVDQLEVERRWKMEQLKPELNLKYNALNASTEGDPFANYSPNNYTWGLEFSMPLFLRKERGGLRDVNAKLSEAQLDVSNKQQMLNAKAIQSLNEWNTSANQIRIYRRTVIDYAGLLEGERQLFSGGESSLFMVNAREIGYINTQVKLAELVTKNRMAALKAAYTFAILPEN